MGRCSYETGVMRYKIVNSTLQVYLPLHDYQISIRDGLGLKCSTPLQIAHYSQKNIVSINELKQGIHIPRPYKNKSMWVL